MKLLLSVALLVAAFPAQATRWVSVATGPEGDPAGLYIDRESVAGKLPMKTVTEKFVNSYMEEKLSLVEMNCARHTWRTLRTITRTAKGIVLQRANFPDAKGNRISSDSPQETVSRMVCMGTRRTVASTRRTRRT